MSDLVELLNDLNQSNRIEYSDYSQLMFCVQQLEEQTQNLAKRICELQSDLSKEKSKNEKTIEELEKEKCELLGLIQAKDKLIEKMKCCGNCKYEPVYDEQGDYLIAEECHICFCKSNWELAE